GVEPGVFVNVNIGPSAYSFVQTRYFLDRRLGSHFAPESRNAFLLGSTRNATRYDFEGSRIINRGVDVRQAERWSGRRVEQLQVRDSNVATRERVSNREVMMYRPGVERNGGPVTQNVDPRVDRRGAQPRFEQQQRVEQQRGEQRRAEQQQ